MAIWATQSLASGFIPFQGVHGNSPSVFQRDLASFDTGHPQVWGKKKGDEESCLLLVQGGKENTGPVWGHALLVALKAAITTELKRVISPLLVGEKTSEDPPNEPILRQELFGDGADSSPGTVRYTTTGTQRHPGALNLLQPRSSEPKKVQAPGCRRQVEQTPLAHRERHVFLLFETCYRIHPPAS